MSKRGSGLPDIVNPCIDKFVKTKEYYELCKKHKLTESCYPNDHFPKSDKKVVEGPYTFKTKDL